MKDFNKYLGVVSTFLFITIASVVYGFLIQINPIPPFNIIIWGAFCFLIHKVFLVNFTTKKPYKKILIYFTITVCIYLIYVVKSVYFVALFNQIYLTGSTKIIPIEFEESLLRTLIKPSVFIQKLEFFLSWDSLSISFGENYTLSFGNLVTNIFRILEILGIIFSQLVCRSLFKKIAFFSK